MAFVALLLVLKFALYCGFFYATALVLQMGTPVDALRAGFHRTWLGAAATLVSLIVYIFFRLAHASEESTRIAGTVLIWLLRAGVWTAVLTSVYRVTRWRKGKLALAVLLGLALNVGVDVGLARLQGEGRAFMPSIGQWDFRIC